MAEAKSQQTIEGAVDVVPDSVYGLGAEYARASYEWKKLGKQLETLKPMLMEVMAEHDVSKCEVTFAHEGVSIRCELTRSVGNPKLQCKKLGDDAE